MKCCHVFCVRARSSPFRILILKILPPCIARWLDVLPDRDEVHVFQNIMHVALVLRAPAQRTLSAQLAPLLLRPPRTRAALFRPLRPLRRNPNCRLPSGSAAAAAALAMVRQRRG